MSFYALMELLKIEGAFYLSHKLTKSFKKEKNPSFYPIQSPNNLCANPMKPLIPGCYLKFFMNIIAIITM